MPSIPSFSLSLEKYLYEALESLVQAFKRLEEEEEEKQEQVGYLVSYTQSIIEGGNPFATEEEEDLRDVLKGLVEEVRALCKEVVPIKETYAERLKKDLPSSSSSLPPLLSPSSTPSPSSRVTSSMPSSSSTSTKSKKKQLQERRLVLITDEKDQPLNTFSIRNKVN
jgi:hypothetical protein